VTGKPCAAPPCLPCHAATLLWGHLPAPCTSWAGGLGTSFFWRRGEKWCGGDQSLVTKQLAIFLTSYCTLPCKRAIISLLILILTPVPPLLLWGRYGKNKKAQKTLAVHQARRSGCRGTGLGRAGGKVPALLLAASA